MADKVYVDNNEATQAWNTVLFDRFSEYRHIFVGALKLFSDDALAQNPPSEGDRVVDLGCGFGDTAQQLARIVGPQGFVIGVDAAERFVEQAQEEADEAGFDTLEFRVADVQVEVPDGPYEYAFARMGTMFFAGEISLRNQVSVSSVVLGIAYLVTNSTSTSRLTTSPRPSNRAPKRSSTATSPNRTPSNPAS